MEIAQNIIKKLAVVCDEWNEAEASIKEAEQISRKVVTPAVNELRYAGRKLIDSICMLMDECGGTEEEVIAKLNDVMFDCHRAQHDAIDAAVLAINIDVNNIRDGVKANTIIKVYPEYSELLSALQDTHQQIKQARKNRNDRYRIYDSVRSVEFQRLKDAYINFSNSRSVLVEVAKEDRRTDIRNQIIGWGGFIFGVVGLLFAFFS